MKAPSRPSHSPDIEIVTQAITTAAGHGSRINKSGAKNIYDNRVDGNLQCKSNTPAPKGWGNRVSGDKEGQCARL